VILEFFLTFIQINFIKSTSFYLDYSLGLLELIPLCLINFLPLVINLQHSYQNLPIIIILIKLIVILLPIDLIFIYLILTVV